MRLRRGLLLLLLVGLVVSVGPAAWSQQIPRATCLDCHEQEGMEYAILQATPYVEIPEGETQELDITVANPWLHEITSSRVTVDLSNASALSFDTPDPLNVTENATMSPGDAPRNVSFPVQTGATGIIARLHQPDDASGAGGVDADMTLWLPDGTAIEPEPDGVQADNPLEPPTQARSTEQIAVPEDRLANTGGWNLSMELANGPPQTDLTAEIQVLYNTTTTQSLVISDTIAQSESSAATFLVKGVDQGEVRIDYDVTVTAFYEHPPGIGSQDEGNETLSRSLNFTVGDQLERGEAGPAVPETPPINWKMNARIWGEATGFIGLFMVPLSLVLGGAFGRRNVLWANKLTRSARIRVLWHNALSFVLLGISILHLVLFLYEPVYDWSVGMVWGGTATLALIGLGITGGFQRRFARSLGYDTWRLLHISMAVVFVASLLVHVLVDGAHFDFLRDWLGLTST